VATSEGRWHSFLSASIAKHSSIRAQGRALQSARRIGSNSKFKVPARRRRALVGAGRARAPRA
jgi:hypothetical protein